MSNKETKIAIIGATGNVGRIVISKLISEKIVSPKNLQLFASPKSTGTNLCIDNNRFTISDINKTYFSEFDICVFNTESEVSEKLVPIAVRSGAYVIDSSSHYRLQSTVPLIVPPVNIDEVKTGTMLYAHANCIVSPIATVITPLHKQNPITHINITTFQSVSGAGKIACDDCWNETDAIVNGKSYEKIFFKKQIAFNLIPQIGDIESNYSSSEENKIKNEIQRIVDKKIFVNTTAVRVPILQGHSAALTIRFQNKITTSECTEIIKQSSSVILNNNDNNHYSTPIDIVGKDDVVVGRVRADISYPLTSYNLWLCSDNLRRGAATDSVEIVKKIITLLKPKQ